MSIPLPSGMLLRQEPGKGVVWIALERRLFFGAMILVLAIAKPTSAADPAGNDWVRLDKAELTGKRWDVPLGYDPVARRSWSSAAAPPSATTRSRAPTTCWPSTRQEGRWENWFPPGKDWGPQFGPCQAPAWKDEHFHFRDAEGNVRPNWTVYGTFSLGQKYDYDPDTKAFVFYAGGRTFRYDPADARLDRPRARRPHPEKELGGILLWSSMCYDRHNKQFRPLRRRQRPERARRPRHLDLLARRRTPGRSSSSTTSRRSGPTPGWSTTRCTRRSSSSAATSSTSCSPTPGPSTW